MFFINQINLEIIIRQIRFVHCCIMFINDLFQCQIFNNFQQNHKTCTTFFFNHLIIARVLSIKLIFDGLFATTWVSGKIKFTAKVQMKMAKCFSEMFLIIFCVESETLHCIPTGTTKSLSVRIFYLIPSDWKTTTREKAHKKASRHHKRT